MTRQSARSATTVDIRCLHPALLMAPLLSTMAESMSELLHMFNFESLYK